MNPLVAIAASVFPDILKAVIGGDSAGVVDAVTKAVSNAAGTSVPADAQKKIESDPAAEKELKIKLAEIAAEEEQKRREHELAEQKLQIEQAEAQRKAEMEAMRLRFEEDAKLRDDDFRKFQAEIADTQAARTSFADLARARNPFAWGPVVISLVVSVGFFWILAVLVSNWFNPSTNELVKEVSQIVNIAIGALTAGFATVISFWLGSSQGSRNKDFAAVEIQAKTASESARIIERQAEQTEAILKERSVRVEPVPEQPKPSNFKRCVAIILEKEGGYVDHPNDPGGATNMGITFNTLKDWRGTAITKQDVKDLTEEEARNIYEARYWKPLNCDSLPHGVDLVTFDFGVNAGPGRSAKLLQRVCGANADGVIGPITVGAVDSLDASWVVRRFSQLRMDYYRSLKTWETFGRGWTRRTDEVEGAALRMIG